VGSSNISLSAIPDGDMRVGGGTQSSAIGSHDSCSSLVFVNGSYSALGDTGIGSTKFTVEYAAIHDRTYQCETYTMAPELDPEMRMAHTQPHIRS
jgi:hypothetical protein